MLQNIYIHVTVHHNRFLFNNQQDALIIRIYSVIKLYMFRTSSLFIIRIFLLSVRMELHGVPSWLYLEAVIKKPAWNLPVPNVQYKTP